MNDSSLSDSSDEQESMIKQMHPLRKATIKELFPVIGIMVHGTLENSREHTISESLPTFSDRPQMDLQRFGKKGRNQGLAKGVNRNMQMVEKSLIS